MIQGEVTTTNINQVRYIKGIKRPSHTKEIKISQYADDSNFLLTDQKSVEKVITFFQNLNKASGVTINLDKTKISPINTDQINYLQNQLPDITIKDRYQTKTLGIFFVKV